MYDPNAANVGRPMTDAELTAAGLGDKASVPEAQPTNPDGTAIPAPDASSGARLEGGALPLPSKKADPDTTLDGEPFVQGDSAIFPIVVTEHIESPVLDVFAVVATYDHVVETATAPEYPSYDEARAAGIEMLAVNANVVHFKIDKRTVRKA